MSRNIVSYDDIAPPPPPPPAAPPAVSAGAEHANKRRKQNNRQSNGGGRHAQHWDDPSVPAQPPPAAGPSMHQSTAKAPRAPVPEEESRELTHEEIWDDSALVDAWDAAQEEYHALNGPDKAWKKDPVHKSALSWYNVPPAKKPQAEAAGPIIFAEEEQVGQAADDSRPYDFNTFVPPMAGTALPAVQVGPTPLLPAPGGSVPMVSRDEAFQNALSSMYWTGYWTAAYYYQQQQQRAPEPDGDDAAVDEEDEEEVIEEIEMGVEADVDDFLPTQR